jgi:hypothetical protein
MNVTLTFRMTTLPYDYEYNTHVQDDHVTLRLGM